MESIAEYLLSVTGSAIISAVILRLLDGKGSAASIAKMLTGIFVVLTLLAPVTQVQISDLLELVPDLSADAKQAVNEGKTSAQNALTERISGQVEAYILDKAEQLGLRLSVEVALSNDPIPVPVSVRLQGHTSPYAKMRLQSILQEDLGIKKENQIWT